jgi:GT2 family glycosyltransferase/tRNA A-37 threonylcarbamoyl transferase component Bud32
MQFNEAALASKRQYLDGILSNEPLLNKVFSEFAGGAPYQYAVIPRPWNPGGGATLFSLTAGSTRAFVKVKHRSVLVESKLESEPAFSRTASLAHEAGMLQQLRGVTRHLPTLLKYVEEDGYGFLFLEPLASFAETIRTMGACQVVQVYQHVERAVRDLFDHGIVHTDVHENNVLFRGMEPVLVDFEEARRLSQSVPFEESLDVTGANQYGDVGEMPSEQGFLKGRTCLTRLKQVFEQLVRDRLESLIKACNFDSSCPFLTALDHGRDDRIYQSINLPGISIEGQRPLFDSRIRQIAGMADRLFTGPYVHLDIGSNLGRFNLELARHPRVRKSIGVEAYDKYVDLSIVLAFLSGTGNAEFFCAECGKDSLADLLREERVDLVTIYSVYHHIKDKTRFLRDLKRLNPACIMFEWAVQEECYAGKTWQDEMALVCRELGMPHTQLLGESEDYRRPVVLLSRTPIPASAPAPVPAAAPSAGRTGPRVSVVLPTYNHADFLPGAIQSILAQTYADFELIIVNDGSTDGTKALLDTLTDTRIRVIHQANQRLPRALNAGFAAATGELLTWTSADNYCAPLFLEALVAALDAHPDAGLAYSAFGWINESDQITGIHRDQDFSYHSLLAQNPGNASFLYRRACQDRVGQYDPELEGAEDWDMWMRIVEHYSTVYVPEILYYYRMHDRSMTSQKREQVHRASCGAFRKAVTRKQGTFSLGDLYPALQFCADQRAAEFHACLDFGTTLLRSPFSQVDLAVRFLERARAAAPTAAAVAANLAVAYGRAGQWDQAVRLCEEIASLADTGIRALCERIREAHRQRRSDLLAAAPLFLLNKNESELFRLERERRKTHALTDQAQTQRSDSPRPEPLQAAPPVQDRPAPSPEAGAPIAVASESQTATSQVPDGKDPDPLVSVIVPTFNRPGTLIEAVKSVLNQTYRNLEVIVVNDAGADVENLVTYLNQDGRVTYIKHGKNRGLAASRNTGIGAARGKYIAYLDDDDRFYPQHVETLVRFLEGSEFRAAYTDAHRAHQELVDGTYVTKEKTIPYSYDFDPLRILVCNYFPVLCMMHERACLEEAGIFDETLTTHEDWDLWIRISRKFPFAHIKQVTAEFTWRTDGTSMTSSIRPDYLRTARIIHEKYRALSETLPAVVAAQQQQMAAMQAAIGGKQFTCSIIIPVFNKADLTSQCLVNLAKVTQDVEYEVIIVDNGSTDETRSLLASLDGDVRTVTNQENLGFAKACNQGAQKARGRYLVFLNNDTIPLEGWLKAMVDEVEANPDVAVVGSKLLFADGTVQHAGVVFSRIWFTPYHIYRGFPADAIGVNRRREFQCVTAACMLIRKDVFEDVGAFDEGYRNGFEDVDLCLRISEQGHRIIYQPKSVLYHLESQTPGRKTHDQENGRRLLARWQKHWWIPDEDLFYVQDGYAHYGQSTDGKRKGCLRVIDGPEERARWELVAETQRRTRRRELGPIRACLEKPDDWPRDADILQWAARLCGHIGANDLEEKFWRRVLAIEESKEARTTLARLELERGRLSEAALHLDVLLARAPGHGDGWLLQGILAMQQQEYERAVAAFTTANCHGADSRKARLGLVMAALGQGQSDCAWELCLKLIAEYPDDSEILHWLLRAGTMLEQWETLQHRLVQFSERNPGDLAARFALAGVLIRRNQPELAKREYHRLRLLAPSYEGLEELGCAVEHAMSAAISA